MGTGFITAALLLIYWELSNIADELEKMNIKGQKIMAFSRLDGYPRGYCEYTNSHVYAE